MQRTFTKADTAPLAIAMIHAENSWAKPILLVLFSLLTALSAHIAISLPFTPVPITGQTFVVLLSGLLLGRKLGALAQLVYLVEGLAGLPVFAKGACCLSTLLGPSGGYLLAFPVAAFVVGVLAEHGWDRRPIKIMLAMLAGNLCIYAVGVAVLARFVGMEQAFSLGVVPFLSGDVLKLLLAAGLLPLSWLLLLGRTKM